jgi:hypothetical protein
MRRTGPITWAEVQEACAEKRRRLLVLLVGAHQNPDCPREPEAQLPKSHPDALWTRTVIERDTWRGRRGELNAISHYEHTCRRCGVKRVVES